MKFQEPSKHCQLKFSRSAEERKKIVISNTLERVEWKDSMLIKNNIAEEIQKLKQQPGKNMIVAGGANIAQTFAKLELIDEKQLTVHPVIRQRKTLLKRPNNTRRD